MTTDICEQSPGDPCAQSVSRNTHCTSPLDNETANSNTDIVVHYL